MDIHSLIHTCTNMELAVDNPLCLLVESLPVMVFEVTRDGTVMYINEAVYPITGYHAREIVGKNFWEVFFSGDNKQQVAAFLAQSASGEVRDKRMTMVSKHGEVITTVWNAFSIPENKVRPEIILGSIVDITEQQKAETALHELEDELRAIHRQVLKKAESQLPIKGPLHLAACANREFAAGNPLCESIINLPVVAVELTPNGNILFVNEAVTAITGHKPEELIGKNWWDIFYPESERQQITKYLEAIRQGDVHNYEMTLHKEDGCPATILWNTMNIYDEQKNLSLIIQFGTDITHQKQVEADLQRERDLFGRVMEISPVGTLLVNTEGDVIYASRQLAHILHIPLESMTGKNFYSLGIGISDCTGKPGSRESFPLHIVIKRREAIFDLCYQIITPDGEHVLVSVNAAPLLAKDGSVEAVVMKVEDITGRVQTEDELRRERDLLGQIMETSPTGVMLMDRNGKFTFANKEAEEKMGISRSEITQRTYNDPRWMMTDCEGKPVSENEMGFSRVMVTKQPIYESCRIIKKPNGEDLYISINFAPIFGKNGEIDFIIVTFEDVTVQYLIQKEMANLNQRLKERAKELGLLNEYLRHERQFLEKIMQTSPVGIVMVDPAGKFFFSNEQAEHIMELSRSEIVDRTYDDLRWNILDCNGNPIPTEKLPFVLARKGEIVLDYCMTMTIPAGKTIYLSMNIAPYYDENGDVEGVIAMFHDVSDRLFAQRQLAELNNRLEDRARELAESNADLERFAFIASHDLKEPLNVIIGYARLLEKRLAGKTDPETDEFIHYIVDDAGRMQRMVNGLLQLSRVSTRGQIFRPTDTNAVLRMALINLEARITESGAAITSDELPTVLCDEAQIMQVFQNLIGNAIKYRYPNRSPKIHISARKDNNRWLFSISDNGIGIAPKNYKRIFKIFQTIQQGTQNLGSGIGLAICEKIIHRHGGEIWVESQPGEGSTFYFTIPIR